VGGGGDTAGGGTQGRSGGLHRRHKTALTVFGGGMVEIDDATYNEWQRTCVKCSDEKEKVTAALQPVIDEMESRHAMLDIGAGDGNLTLRLAPSFKLAVAVDPNTTVGYVFESQGIRYICAGFEDTDIGSEKFDLIVCSHVFWLVKKADRPAFIEKMLSHLSPRGKAAIIMGAPRGQSHDFHKQFFFGHDMSSHDIMSEIQNTRVVTRVIPVSSTIQTPSFEDFFNICKLFVAQSWLHPSNVRNYELVAQIGDIGAYTHQKFEEIEAYIRDRCFHDGVYRMVNELDIIVFSE